MKRVVGIVFAAATLGALGQAQDAKTAEQVYKNITELKGVPADQVGPAMQFIAASLGVNCEFCHVQGKFESDEKGPKRTARQMMAMTAMINKTSFGGRQQITCNSCHNGSERPAAVPRVQESDMPAHTAAAAPAPGAQQPTVDEILEKYVGALGGADALQKVTSRVMKGSIVVNGTTSPVEVYAKAPNLRVTISQMNGRASYTAFDGKAGWMGNPGRPAREMSPAESAASSLDADFALGLHLKELYPQLRRVRPEAINGIECNVLMGTAPGKPMVRLYFEKSSGLLLRMVRLADTPMGRMPTQIDYADYRATGGAMTPWRWTLSRPTGRFTIQISEAQANVPIDDAKFAKPEGEVK